MIRTMGGSLEGAARVFAAEFCRSTESITGPSGENMPGVLTPTGAACGRILVAGAVTEMTDAGSSIRCRIADPTGVFEIELAQNGKTEVSDAMKSVPVPSFLVVVGRAQLRPGTASPSVIIRPDSVQVVTRAVRDAWIMRTSECTLDRLAVLADALSGGTADPVVAAAISRYALTLAGLGEFVTMVESALAGLAAAPEPHPEAAASGPDAKEVLTAILTELQGPRGMPVEELVAKAVLRGVVKERAEEGIAEMIRNDDCYQPQKGSVRLL